MSTTYLKIKIKSLAEEARIIRHEERRIGYTNYKIRLRPVNDDQTDADNIICEYNDNIRNGLHQHRVLNVRHETRAALLAYGFLRGRDYIEIENSSTNTFYECINAKKMMAHLIGSRVIDLVFKYGNRGLDRTEIANSLIDWFQKDSLDVGVTKKYPSIAVSV